jgi:Double zinc ribbon
VTPLAYFGIESSGLSLVIDLLILFVAVLYGSLVYWTYADARRRIVDPMLIGCATAASLFPFVGTVIYMILRPPEYLEDVHERELEVQAAEVRLHELEHSLCPHCDYPVERDFIRCPSCLHRLKERCMSCSRPLDRAWTICPYCETEVAGAKPARSVQRRSRAAAAETALIAGGTLSDETSPAEVLDEDELAKSRAKRSPRARRPRPTS